MQVYTLSCIENLSTLSIYSLMDEPPPVYTDYTLANILNQIHVQMISSLIEWLQCE